CARFAILGSLIAMTATIVSSRSVVAQNGPAVSDEIFQRSAILFPHYFSRFTPGPLTAPLGKLNAAIQEYHYLANRGLDLGPWENAICPSDAWGAGEEDGRCCGEQQLPPSHADMVPQYFAPLFVTGDATWRDYTVD